MKWLHRLARGVLSWILPADEREAVLGDVDEEFELRVARAGPTQATLWYCSEVTRSVWPLLTYPTRWRGGMMRGVAFDIRSGLKVFRRAPGFAAVVVLTTALGVGGVTAVFSVVRGVLLRPLPYDEPSRVVMMWGQSSESPRSPLTVGDFNAMAEQVSGFDGVSGQWSNNALILGDGDAEQVSVGWVTPEYWDVVGIKPRIGRTMAADEEAAVLLSHALWARRYGADPEILGTTIDLSGDLMEVVGVLPDDRDPNVTTFGGGLAGHQMWRLQPPGWTTGDDRSIGWLRTTARLGTGVPLDAAQAEVNALMERINPTVEHRDGGQDLRIQLTPVRADLVGGLARTMWILLGAVTGVLLIAATNIAHLMLARGEGRSTEVAVRAALGGSRLRLFRQFLVESTVLALVGGVLGAAFASLGVRALLSVAPATLPRLGDVRVDGFVYSVALAATLLATLVFAVVPAVRASRTNLAGSMGERTSTGSVRSRRLSGGLVIAEVAMSLVLLTSTGLLLKSFGQLDREDLGFEREGVVTFAVEAPDWGNDAESARAGVEAYLTEIAAVPGVRAAGLTNRVPLGGGLFTGTFRSADMAAAEEPAIPTALRYVTPEYFEALGAGIVDGRAFRQEDGLDRIIIDEVAAEAIWPGETAVGRFVETGGALGGDLRLAEVVGVVAPMKHHGVAQEPGATLYIPMLAAAHQQNFRYAIVGVSGDPAAYLSPLRAALKAVHGDAVVARYRTMTDLFDQDVAATRFAALLLTLFGAVALLLAAVGLHGVVAYTVRRRARDFGIRMALGAQPGSILRQVLGSGTRLVLAGVLIGAVLSLAAGQLLGALLYEVRPSDPAALLGAAAVMLAVGVLGAYLPARFVLAVDPAVTLRDAD